ncbi:hypothetical protein GDO78_000811 [Eleutherodactylus coqui]|uniref:GRIP domain-containing protein n=1 Tax=Eleutherodactylus coqui TaxID=57060 RepID=A0A8J6FRJ8_ELECQ|nr:hypothetical protein GDO78_000811 [Eleutherodactylus coqui]
MLIQKVKSRCADLEKEVEELKSKPTTGAADDVVQALTERLDAVLLEKAETHQQFVSMKKELNKTKEESEAAAKKAGELQQQLEHSNRMLLEEIVALKTDLSESQDNHKEDVATLKKELQDALVKQREFTERLSQQQEQDSHVNKLEQELQHMHQDYEERLSNLQKDLDSVTEEKNDGMTKLKDAEAASEQNLREIQDLHAKILELQALHKEEVSNLTQEFETSTKVSEKEKSTLQDVINQYHEKEKILQEDDESSQRNSDVSDEPNVTSQSEGDKVQQLKCDVKELESQQSLLKDELTYTNNLKFRLEREVQHLKNEYFHEREELEFKINELQLAIEEYNSLIEKLKAELESTKIESKQLAQEKAIDIQSLRDQHKKELYERTQAITSRFEDEKFTFVHEMQILKEQCKNLHQEKEEAISNYESLRETFVSLQAELQDSAGKISQEFETMKHQQATDVHELQQKLRTAYKEKNDLQEAVNQLQSKVDMFSSKESEYEELQVKITTLQQNNEEYLASLHKKEEFIEDLQLKVDGNSKQSAEISALHEEIHKLQEMYKSEQVSVEGLQQKIENQGALNSQLKKTIEELTEKLQESLSPSHLNDSEDPQLQITSWQQKNEEVTATLHEKEKLLKDLQLKMQETTKQNTELSSRMQNASTEVLELQEMLKSEQAKALNFQQEIENHVKLIAQLEETIEKLTQKLSTTIQSLEEIKNLQQQVDTLLLEKQHVETDSRRWQDEVLQLREQKEVLSRDFDKLISEHNHCFVSIEELGDLRKKVQLITEEKDEVTGVLVSKEQSIEMFQEQLCILQDILAIECRDQDFIPLLENINKAVLQLKEEKENVFSQKEETSAQIERLHEEYEIQFSELRALLSDYSKEKGLLKEELEETLRDKEALQRDLLEMKHTLEKSKLDNQDLLSRIEVVTADLNAVQKEKCIESSEQEDVRVENTEGTLMQEVTGAEDLLSKSLDLQQKSLLADLQNKIESLERESKEKEEKCNKIKAVAVKAKKELDANKKEVQSIKEELERVRAEKQQLASSMKDVVKGAESYQSLLAEYDRQVELLELEKEKVKSVEHQLEDLSCQLRTATLEQEKMNSIHEDLVSRWETLQSNNKLLEAQILETQKDKAATERDLEAEKLIKEQKVKDHNYAVKQVEDLQAQLQKDKKLLQKVTQDFELVRKDAQKSTLMGMEIADYERLVKELNQKITNKSSQLEDLEQEVRVQKQKQETLQEEISSLQTNLEQHEERSTKMKQLLVKTKKELSDSKQAESDYLILQASLKGELEASQQHVEAYKAEQAAVTAEFESYKVRVHNVLKQQKSKSASQAEQEAFKYERDHLQTMLDQVKTKLQETKHTLQMNTAELQSLQTEHDMLLERHNKMLQETVTKEAELREKLCTLQSENMVLKTEHAQVVSQLSAQNEVQRNSFRDQVRHLQDDHRKTVETLQQQLSKVEAQLFQVKSEVAITTADISQWQPELSKEELTEKLNTTSKSVDHLSGLLHETEATNAMLMEQVTLLKNEIRRLERNQEREKSVANLEYLKNVLLQFIFLKAGSERQRLLPVIDTMLQLSPEEKAKLFSIAQGEEESAARPAGWASYLHSWSGLR